MRTPTNVLLIVYLSNFLRGSSYHPHHASHILSAAHKARHYYPADLMQFAPDQDLQCKHCSTIFPFTAGEQAYYKRNNLALPTSCKGCRRKLKGGNTPNAKLPTSSAQSDAACPPTSIKVPSEEHPTLRSALNTLSMKDATGAYEVHLASGVYDLDGDDCEDAASGDCKGPIENERGVGFLFKTNGQHVQIVGASDETKDEEMSRRACNPLTVITSSKHSLFQASGRSTHLELRNLHLLHTCHDDDKSKIGACVFGMGRSNITISNCTLLSRHGFALWGVQNTKVNVFSCKICSQQRSGGVFFGNSHGSFVDCAIHDCLQHGLCLRGNTELLLQNCRFTNNKFRALYGYAAASIQAYDSTFEGTSSDEHAAVEMKITKKSSNSITKFVDSSGNSGGDGSSSDYDNKVHGNEKGWGKRNQTIDKHVNFIMVNCSINNNAGIGVMLRRNTRDTTDMRSDDDNGENGVSIKNCSFVNNAHGNVVNTYDDDDELQRKVALSTPMWSTSNLQLLEWQFERDDQGLWQSYTPETNAYINEKYIQYMSSSSSPSSSSPSTPSSSSNINRCTLPSPLDMYTIDFQTMMQTNTMTFFSRSIRGIAKDKMNVYSTDLRNPLSSLSLSSSSSSSSLVKDNLFIFDAHCHLQFDRENAEIYMSSVRQLRKFGICGTSLRDWSDVLGMKNKFPDQCCIGLGIHPYQAHTYVDNKDQLQLDLCKLEATLQSDPNIFVGEIGIDKAYVNSVTKKNEFVTMVEIFERQFEIATRLGRPVVIHNVRAHGYFYEFLRNKHKKKQMLPPKIYLHAYAGNEEITRQLLKLNVDGSNDKGGASCCELYFGFAAASNMRNEKKLSNVLKLIPTSRLLIESDGEFLNVSSKSRSSSSSSSSGSVDSVERDEDSPRGNSDTRLSLSNCEGEGCRVSNEKESTNTVESHLMIMRNFMCHTLEMDAEELCALTTENAHIFFGKITQ